MNVTFDSNVFQHVVRPDKFPNDPEAGALSQVNLSLKNNVISGFISETMADLEAICRDARASYFSTCRPATNAVETELPDGTIKLSIALGPDPGAHPGVHQILEDRFSEARALGFKFLRCPRINLPRPQIIRDEWFAAEADLQFTKARQEKFSAVLSNIDAKGVGIEVVKNLGRSLLSTHGKNGTWFEGLAYAQSKSELKAVAGAVGEWADADSVAAHIAYGNDLFCTRDSGISAGTSILDSNHRAWLFSNYRIIFVTVSDLAARL